MIAALGQHPDGRRLRLVACACTRRLGERLDTRTIWQAIEATEDADRTPQARLTAQRLVRTVLDDVRLGILHDRSVVPEWMLDYQNADYYVAQMRTYGLDHYPVAWAATVLGLVLQERVPIGDYCRAIDEMRQIVDPKDRDQLVAERVAQCDLVREVFGNPFRPVAFDPAWRTWDVLLLAKGIDDDRAYDRMPILADALQDAGCDNDEVLNHCRGPGSHAPGCWVVDLVLASGCHP
jgi:hypothetical protein